MKKWQIKALVQQAISRIPFTEQSSYFLQRYVSRKLKTNEKQLQSTLKNARLHLDAIAAHSGRPLGECHFYEFGAGWNLKGPLAFWCWGVDHQVCIDIAHHVRWDLVNNIIEVLQKMDHADFSRVPQHLVHSREDLLRHYGIDYQAPCDARDTGLESGSIDAITSTFTLEHIPQKDIATILAESHRILKPGGLMSHLIDYQDHYSYFDRSINRYNFLQFSERAWRLYNSSVHFQTRARHKDYLKLTTDAGFETVLDDARRTPENLRELAQVAVHAEFQETYTTDELAVRSGHIVSVRG